MYEAKYMEKPLKNHFYVNFEFFKKLDAKLFSIIE